MLLVMEFRPFALLTRARVEELVFRKIIARAIVCIQEPDVSRGIATEL
jgi:hypothetical protein